MGGLNLRLDEAATRTIAVAKVMARREGSPRLDGVHVFKAALLDHPQVVARQVSQAGEAWSKALPEQVRLPEGFDKPLPPMPLSAELARALRELERHEGDITLEGLLKAILHKPSKRLRELLRQGHNRASRTQGQNGSGTTPQRYGSKRDWLWDLHREWLLRKRAARACGLSVGWGEHHPRDAPLSESVLDSVVRVSTANRCKAEATPKELHPLGTTAAGLEAVQRAILEGIVVDHLYGLDIHPLGGLCVREIAQMLSPEIYPANCRKVLEAVEWLEKRGFLKGGEHTAAARLTDRLHLSEQVLSELLTEIEADPLSAGEVRALKRQIRHGIEWTSNDASKVD